VEGDGDDNTGPHIANDVDREIIDDPSVDEDLVVAANWGEEARDRDGGAEGGKEVAAVEDDLMAFVEVDGDAAEGNREIVEGREVGIMGSEAGQNKSDAVSRREGGGGAEAAAKAKFQLVRESAAVFLAPEVQLAERGGGEQGFVPIDCLEKRADLGGGGASRVHSADQSAHARAGDEVDGDPVFFEPGENADVCEAKSGTAGEGEADFRAGLERERRLGQ
jgi:hypothetical protein